MKNKVYLIVFTIICLSARIICSFFSTYGNTNNIKVTVLNNSNEIIDKLKALDSKGGAIEIEYNEKGMATQDLLVNAE